MKGQIGSVGRNAWGVHKSDGTSLDNSPSDSNIEASDEGSHLQIVSVNLHMAKLCLFLKIYT